MSKLYVPYNGGNAKIRKLYVPYNGGNARVKSLYESNGTSWVKIFTGEIPYTSTYNFMYYGSAMDSNSFSFYVSGSSKGFYATITFDEPIPITSFSFSLSRQNADIDVYFSGYMELKGVDSGIITDGSTQASVGASTSKSVGCSSGLMANPVPSTLVKYIEIHASGSVSELYFTPYITTMGNSVQLSRYGQIQL